MMRTSQQLKSLVRNLSMGDSAKSQTIIRNYVMERFLERLSLSRYRKNLILKGGVLVAAMIGLDKRSTMDIDTTIKGLALSAETIRGIVTDISLIEIDDGMAFEIHGIESIMDEMEYPGIRVMLSASLEKMRIPLKLDFSTGDIVTPSETAFSLKLLFENRTISVLAYTLETVIAEKLETLLVRGTLNTRMRDFYDIYVLENTQTHSISARTLYSAFKGTVVKRGTAAVVADADLILREIESDAEMITLWSNYQRKFDYASDISWEMAIAAVRRICEIALTLEN
jgi:predicted nucleotidyltransferase component of viral defense system